MDDKKELEVFPFTPTSVIERRSHEFTTENFSSDAINDTINNIIYLMYEYPEREYYVFIERNNPKNSEVSKIFDEIGILTKKVDYFYYKHPKFINDFIQILESAKWDWQKEVVKTEEMYLRRTLTLSVRLTRKIDMLNLVQTIEEAKDFIMFQPNFYGLGFDGNALWRKLKKIDLGRLI